MKQTINLGFILITLLHSTAFACDFDCTLKRHLDSLQQKDFKTFETTITKEKKLSFILPNGKYFEDSTEYRAMLKKWFAEPGWSLSYKIISIDKTPEMGHALLLVAYDEKERNGKPYHIDHYLSLLFKKEGDNWYLIHDQNTKTQVQE